MTKTGERPAAEASGRETAAGKPSGKAARAGRGKGATGDKSTLRIRLVRSGICTPRDQKATLRALGFRRREQEVERPDHPAVRGMIRKVQHLVVVEGGSASRHAGE